MTYKIIATGSTGNAVLLGCRYLIDCGVSVKALSPYLKDISAVFLTHIHCDHFRPRTLHEIHRRRPSVKFICGRNLLVPLHTEAGIPLENIILAEPGKSQAIYWGRESVSFEAFDLIHNVENIGYRFRLEGSSSGTAMYATDTQYIPVSAPGLDLYLIEANHHVEELAQRRARKAEAGQFFHEDTVAVSHMSVQTAMSWLRKNADPEKSRIVFLHQHTPKEVTVCGMDRSASNPA